MNNELMNKSFSEFESPRQYQILIENCLLKCLSSSQKVLQRSVSTTLRKKIQQIFSLNAQDNERSCREPFVQGIQHFIFTLLGLIQSLTQNLSLFRQRATRNLNNSQSHFKQATGYESNDYQILQKSIQKAQSDIRKHIRLQQQMKIYINDLQDKIQILETQVKNQKIRYQQLFKNIASVNKQKRQMQQKVKRLQQKLGSKERKNQLHQKPTQVMSEAVLKEQLHMYHSSLDKNDVRASGVSAPRKKSLIQKINQRSRKVAKKQSLYSNNLIFVDGSINVNLENPHYSKNLKKDNKNSFEEIKDNIKTIELHQQSKKPIVRRVVRLQTQAKEVKVQKKHQRSSSVLQ